MVHYRPATRSPYRGVMRGGSLLLTALALVGAVVVVSPARAGDTYYQEVRELDGRFDVAGYSCTGEPAAAPTTRIGLSDVHVRGQGSMLVRSAAATLAAPMLVDQRKPSKVLWYAWPTGGTDPRGEWRVEMNGAVLTSEPLALTPRSWNRLWLDDATLHSGDWSGTISEYIAEFGKGGHWKVGFLTGDCLGSPEVRLDAIGTRLATFDFEARSWLDVKVLNEDGSRWLSVRYGEPFRVVARANRWDSAADQGRPVEGARVVFERRWAGTRTWRPVAHERTAADGRAVLEGVSHRAAWWRAVWRRSPEPVPSEESYQGSDTVWSLPLVNGRRCTADGDPALACTTVTVRSGRVVLSGHARPGGSAIVHLYLYDGPSMSGLPLLHQQVRLDRDGHWRIAFATGDHDRLYARLDTEQTTKRHWPGLVLSVPLRVR